MAITKNKTEWNDELKHRVVVGTETSYVGRVLDVFHKDFAMMSDVWTIATFATVVELDGTINDVLVNCNDPLDDLCGRAQVDASPECIAIKAEHDRKKEEQRLAHEEQLRLAREEFERNRPVIGKQMRVARGRKVPVGTLGTVAYVHDSGNVLLKDDASWRDRRASGVWVSPKNLVAR